MALKSGKDLLGPYIRERESRDYVKTLTRHLSLLLGFCAMRHLVSTLALKESKNLEILGGYFLLLCKLSSSCLVVRQKVGRSTLHHYLFFVVESVA